MTISLFQDGLVVWTPNGPNMEFWESESKPTKLPGEELQPATQRKEVAIKKKEEDPILLFE